MEEIKTSKSNAVIEHEHVHAVYSAIAEHFSNTRYKPWPRIASFIEGFPAGALWADIGCGNGKYMAVNNKRTLSIGCDVCAELVTISKLRGFEVLTANGLHLPYRGDVFDYAISVAVLHHLASSERRKQAIEEICRVLRPGSQVLFYVWAKEQPKFQDAEDENGDLFVPWTLAKPSTSDADHRTDHVYQRFYHLFRKDELESLIAQVDGLRLVESGYDHDNWFAVAEKIVSSQ